MWKKEDEPTATADRRPNPATPGPVSEERAKIGRSIRIRGEVEGDEDLLIEGKVDGSVDLQGHSVTVGSGGEVRADVNGRIVTVDGKVTGNLTAEEQVVLSGSAQVEGDITAPRVVLEDGASFRGGVDMGDHTRHASGKPSRKDEPSGNGAEEDSDKKSSASGADPSRSGKEAGKASDKPSTSASSSGKDSTAAKTSAQGR